MPYYSPSTGGFYMDALHGERFIEKPLTERERKAGKRPTLAPNPATLIPTDAVEISDDKYNELMQAQAAGKQIVTAGKRPVAIEPKLDESLRLASNRRRRDSLLTVSDWTQMPDALLDKPELKSAWADYRQQLRDLDLDGEVIWPAEPGKETA